MSLLHSINHIISLFLWYYLPGYTPTPLVPGIEAQWQFEVSVEKVWIKIYLLPTCLLFPHEPVGWVVHDEGKQSWMTWEEARGVALDESA